MAASMTISSFGLNLVSVFVPLLLLRRGLLLWQVCAFYAAYAFCKLVLNYPATVLTNKRGVRLGLTIGYGGSAGFLVAMTLYLAVHSGWLLLLLPILMAVDHAFGWSAQHLHISQNMDSAHTGRDLATINSLGQIAGVFAPFIGGFIAVWFGQAWLAGVAALCVLAAIIPVRRTVTNTEPMQKASQKVQVEYSFRNAPTRDVVANFAFNINAVVGNIVWPFYLAVVLPNFHSIGLITTISAGVAFLLLFAAGHRGDSGKNHRVLLEGTAATSLGHAGRLLAVTPLGLTFVSALYSTALSYQNIAWTSLYYRHARKGGINYIMSMEIACDLACVMLWSLLGVIAYFTGVHSHIFFTTAFILAAVVTWVSTLMRRDDHLITENPLA